ncbi:unnamed protein product [Ilex paraguariensis]|uniref:Uncharacterized protein n=1 Tax=Ilex paraguariensis TaxID=185542 RepID=A0ABC8QRX0_9AQUA
MSLMEVSPERGEKGIQNGMDNALFSQPQAEGSKEVQQMAGTVMCSLNKQSHSPTSSSFFMDHLYELRGRQNYTVDDESGLRRDKEPPDRGFYSDQESSKNWADSSEDATVNEDQGIILLNQTTVNYSDCSTGHSPRAGDHDSFCFYNWFYQILSLVNIEGFPRFCSEGFQLDFQLVSTGFQLVFHDFFVVLCCFLVAAAGRLWSLFLQLVLLIFSWSLSGSFICLTLAIGLLLWVSLLLLPSAVSWGFVLSGLSVAVLVLGLCSFLMVFIISQLLSLGFPAFLQLNFLDLQLDSQLAFAGLHVPFYVLFFFDGLCHIGFLVFVKARLPCFL